VIRSLALVCLVMGCSGSRGAEAAPSNHKPTIEVTPIADDALCVTKGVIAGKVVEEPTVRGYARGAGGDAAALTFTYKGETFETRALAGGQERRQIGLKLRAQDSCNVVYVMWRLDPKPQLDVSVKFNPGMAAHAECGANGYTKIKPHKKTFVQQFEYGKTHTLRAEIVGDELYAWIDDKLLWQGTLPEEARSIKGPAGVRSDNIKFDLVSFAAPHAEGTPPACKREGGGD
jgi:hypothetical protein